MRTGPYTKVLHSNNQEKSLQLRSNNQKVFEHLRLFHSFGATTEKSRINSQLYSCPRNSQQSLIWRSEGSRWIMHRQKPWYLYNLFKYLNSRTTSTHHLILAPLCITQQTVSVNTVFRRTFSWRFSVSTLWLTSDSSCALRWAVSFFKYSISLH